MIENLRDDGGNERFADCDQDTRVQRQGESEVLSVGLAEAKCHHPLDLQAVI